MTAGSYGRGVCVRDGSKMGVELFGMPKRRSKMVLLAICRMDDTVIMLNGFSILKEMDILARIITGMRKSLGWIITSPPPALKVKGSESKRAQFPPIGTVCNCPLLDIISILALELFLTTYAGTVISCEVWVSIRSLDRARISFSIS
jgi:hypothetical protein